MRNLSTRQQISISQIELTSLTQHNFMLKLSGTSMSISLRVFYEH